MDGTREKIRKIWEWSTCRVDLTGHGVGEIVRRSQTTRTADLKSTNLVIFLKPV